MMPSHLVKFLKSLTGKTTTTSIAIVIQLHKTFRWKESQLPSLDSTPHTSLLQFDLIYNQMSLLTILHFKPEDRIPYPSNCSGRVSIQDAKKVIHMNKSPFAAWQSHRIVSQRTVISKARLRLNVNLSMYVSTSIPNSNPDRQTPNASIPQRPRSKPSKRTQPANPAQRRRVIVPP